MSVLAILARGKVGWSGRREKPRKQPSTVRTTRTTGLLAAVVLSLTMAIPLRAQFTHKTHHGTVTITGYTGPGGAVIIPSSINGDPVTSIGDAAFGGDDSLTSVMIPDSVTDIGYTAFWYCTRLASVTIGTNVTSIGMSAFYGCASLTNVTIPDSVTYIGYSAFGACTSLATVTLGSGVACISDEAFNSCGSLKGVYFKGDAPGVGSKVFEDDDDATVYYLPGKKGWGQRFGGRPAAEWDFPAKAHAAGVGVRNNRFGFDITGTTDTPMVVEACTNLASASWTVVQSCTLTNGLIYFSDATWTSGPARFFRIRSP